MRKQEGRKALVVLTDGVDNASKVNQYNLGFTPEKPLATPGYHRISLTTANKDLTVQTQEGYYAGQ